MFNLHVASPLIARRSSLLRTSCAMRLVMCTTMRSVQVLLLDSSHSAAPVQVERTTKRGASASSTDLCRPGASKRTLWGWTITSIHQMLFERALSKEPSVVYDLHQVVLDRSPGINPLYLSQTSIDVLIFPSSTSPSAKLSQPVLSSTTSHLPFHSLLRDRPWTGEPGCQ